MDAAIARTIVEVCGSRGDVPAVYLFGTVARGVATSDSDIDVAVLFTRLPPNELGDGTRLDWTPGR